MNYINNPNSFIIPAYCSDEKPAPNAQNILKIVAFLVEISIFFFHSLPKNVTSLSLPCAISFIFELRPKFEIIEQPMKNSNTIQSRVQKVIVANTQVLQKRDFFIISWTFKSFYGKILYKFK